MCMFIKGGLVLQQNPHCYSDSLRAPSKRRAFYAKSNTKTIYYKWSFPQCKVSLTQMHLCQLAFVRSS